jgi:hypothetical protein
MKLLCTLIAALLLRGCVLCPAASVTLMWDRNPEAEQVAGYRVWRGDASRNYTERVDAGNRTDASIDVPEDRRSYLAVTAYTGDGLESGYSGEVTFDPRTPPADYRPDISYPIWMGIQPVTLTNGIAHGFASNNVPGVNLIIIRRREIGGPNISTNIIFDANAGGLMFYVLTNTPAFAVVKTSAPVTTAPRKSVSLAPPAPVAPAPAKLKYKPSKGAAHGR